MTAALAALDAHLPEQAPEQPTDGVRVSMPQEDWSRGHLAGAVGTAMQSARGLDAERGEQVDGSRSVAPPGRLRPSQLSGWALGTSSARRSEGCELLEPAAGCLASKRWLVETASARSMILRPVRREWERSSSKASRSSIP